VGEKDRDPADATLARDLNRLLELVEHGLEIAARMLAAKVRGCAVDALHRAADPGPHRERVRGRVQGVATGLAAEAKAICGDAFRLPAADNPGNLVEGLSLAHGGQRFFARANNAVVHAE